MWRGILGSTAFALIAAAWLVAVFAIAFGSGRGFAFDANAFEARAVAHDRPAVTALGTDLLNTISITSLALLGGTAILLALLFRGLPSAVAIVVVIGASNLTTQILKATLPEPDPFGQGLVREFSGTFPSGHATVAMSLAIAFIFASPPWLKGLAALVGAAYAIAIGILLVLLGSHYPSDVAAGYLIAASWAGYAALLGVLLGPVVGRRIRTRRRPEFSTAALATILLGPAALFAGVAAFTVYREPDAFTRGRLSAEFVASCAGIVAVAGIVVVAAMWLPRGTKLLRPEPTEPGPPPGWPRPRRVLRRRES